MALVVMGSLSACVEPQDFSDITKVVGAGQLYVNPTVSEATVVTRSTTPSDASLNEKLLNTLDVFVEHVTDGVGDGTIMRQYHLPLPSDYPFPSDLPATAKTIGDQVQSFLKEYWTKEGLRYGEKYNIYVAVNNTQTRKDEVVNAESLTVATLKGLIADEVTDGLAVVDETTNNISWPWTEEWAHTPSGNIYKQYVSSDDVAAVTVKGDLYGYTTSKEFMMDGILENWTPVAGSKNQVFGKTGENDPNDALILNRAAAKIVLKLKFDADFLHSLTHNKKTEGGTTTWVEKPASEKFSITGAPAWRFYNFAFGAQVFDPGTTYTPVEVHNSATLLRHPYNFVISYDGNGVPVAEQQVAAQIVTYTYPNKWVAADYSTKAPSLVISVPFLQNGQTEPEYHYYRIPLVSNTGENPTTEIKRNHIYVINAKIATRGSELHEDVDEIQDITYEVLPWNDETNTAAIHEEVKAVQHYYFKVNPKVYTLRGDGDQSVVLTYLKAAGTKVNWKLFTYDEDGDQLDVVAKDDDDAIRAWFYNASGEFTTTYNDNEPGVNWSNSGSTPMGVKIEQSTEGTSGSSGTVTVTSHALNNRAIKYIRLRVYLDEAATFINGKESMYEDIIIRHFPTDNIQSIVGSWSSYLPASSSTQTITVITQDWEEVEALVAEHGGSYTSQTVTETEYIDYATYTDHSGETGYEMNGPTASNYYTFHYMVQNETNRQTANSQANAVADGGEGHTYYWGTNPVVVHTGQNWNGYGHQYDYRTGTGKSRQWYKYQNYYSASYTHTSTITEYTVTYTVELESNWVDWERDGGQSYSANNRKYTRASIFTAKIYDNSRNHIYAIEPYQSGSSYTYRIAQSYESSGYYTYSEGGQYGTVRSSMRNLTNNHMYVIQISSTSEGYIMGRPILGKPNANLSQDDVVSPAFMIASQLGAVQTTDNSTTAAEHCRRYMEVTPEGKRYTGWRLPTPDEISVITRYQNGTINGVTISNASYQAMSPVLTGGYYWSLTGNSVSTGLDNDGPYLRCVRDLSAAEVEALNGFDAIIEKYQ